MAELEPPRSPTEAAGAGYLALQALGGIAVWMLVEASPTARSWVELSPGRSQVTDAFFAADMMVVGLSALAARAVWLRRPSATVLTALAVGGVLYPTVYLLSWVTSDEGTGTVPFALMVGVSTLALWALWGVWSESRRHTSPQGTASGGQPSGISSHH